MKSDLEIAGGVPCRPISQIAASLGLTEADYAPYGRNKADRRIDDAGVVCSEGLSEFVLLPLLEKIEIKGLLYGLLTFYAQKVLLLGRACCYLGSRLRFVFLEGCNLVVESEDLVVNRCKDGLTQTRDGSVELKNEGVYLTGDVDEVVPLEDLGVVFLYLVLDGG